MTVLLLYALSLVCALSNSNVHMIAESCKLYSADLNKDKKLTEHNYDMCSRKVQYNLESRRF